MSRKRKPAAAPGKSRPAGGHDRGGDDALGPLALRIIGGTYRGRKLLYSGDARTRPMKDRIREALFNLISADIAGKCAVDMFAGTGALGLEALSRGAARAVFFERHFPTADVISQNIATLAAQAACRVEPANTFIQFRDAASATAAVGDDRPWLVFVSPPYDFYVDRHAEMVQLLSTVAQAAPAGSIIAAESDERFDFGQLPDAVDWIVRDYPPARIALRWL